VLTIPSETGQEQGSPTLSDERLIIGNPVLLIIDMQHDFLDLTGPFYRAGADQIIDPTAKLIAEFRALNLPILFTREVHRQGRVDAGLEADPIYGVAVHTVEGTRGVEIIDELAPRPGEMVVDKRRYNCFLGTELELLLHSLNINTIIICGVTSDVCVHWTAGEAFQRDFHVRVVEDCTAGNNHEASLLLIRSLCSAGRQILHAEMIHAVRAHCRTE